VVVDYRDRGKDKTYLHKAGDTDGWISKKLMTWNQARASEKDYLAWEVGKTATLTVNNLGGVREVRRGSIRESRRD